jgi:hypothetical protein
MPASGAAGRLMAESKFHKDKLPRVQSGAASDKLLASIWEDANAQHYPGMGSEKKTAHDVDRSPLRARVQVHRAA